MPKVTVYIEETLKYQREITIETDENFDETEFNLTLDEIERRANTADDVALLLERCGYKILENPDSDSCLHDSEVEIFDYAIKTK
jgi:hypothetical protein